MERVALVAPVERGRQLLVEVARSGAVQLDLPGETDGDDRTGASGAGGPGAGAGPTRTAEAELQQALSCAIVSGPALGLLGWTPSDALPGLMDALSSRGGSVVRLRPPRGVQPPTLLPRKRSRDLDVLVDTYATVPYQDLDISLAASLAYVLMFGMMFGDVGHGLLLVALALLLRSSRIRRLAWARRGWPFLTGGGVCAVAFGFLYGEFFGPTGVLPVLWLSPLEQPVPLLVTAVGVGVLMLAAASVVGTANRVREGGWGYAVYARTGVPGSLLLVALTTVAVGWFLSLGWLVAFGLAVAAAALALAAVGLVVQSGGGAAGAVEASVELLDMVVRLASNVLSFARLAAFGLTHAALGLVIWQATQAVAGPGGALLLAALVFVVGNALAFGLEALVAGVQALRLEYYELFSRVFGGEGRPFRPWRPDLTAADLAAADLAAADLAAPVPAPDRSDAGPGHVLEEAL